ncbi:MAG: cupin domain-containing protein [Chloroflexota bacterium]|nr:cupin domain-containing protein [Chloroflexota bacterium]
MRTKTRIRSLLALLVLTLGVMVGSSQALSHSQSEATPPAPATGITTEVLGGGQPDTTTGLALALLRITFDPGAVAPPHTHPGATVFSIESGELTFALLDGVATLTPAGGTPEAPSATEELTAGSEVVLTAGDSVFYQGDAVLDERNDSDEPVVILVSNLRGVDEPAREPAATPAA